MPSSKEGIVIQNQEVKTLRRVHQWRRTVHTHSIQGLNGTPTRIRRIDRGQIHRHLRTICPYCCHITNRPRRLEFHKDLPTRFDSTLGESGWRSGNTLFYHARGECLQHARLNALIIIVRPIPEELDHALGRWLRVNGFVGEYCWKSDVGRGAAVFPYFHNFFAKAGEEVAREMLESYIARGRAGDVSGTIACTVYLCGDCADQEQG